MTSTRERKIEFIKSFGTRALETLVMEMLATQDADFLTDEQIKAMCSKQVQDARFRQHFNMRQRAKAKARRILVYVDAGIPQAAE